MRDPTSILEHIRQQLDRKQIHITLHAQQSMAEEEITIDGVLHALKSPIVLENYPDHKRVSCCLLHGMDDSGRDLHIVCTTAQPMLILITVYLPMPPKWLSPTQRRQLP